MKSRQSFYWLSRLVFFLSFNYITEWKNTFKSECSSCNFNINMLSDFPFNCTIDEWLNVSRVTLHTITLSCTYVATRVVPSYFSLFYIGCQFLWVNATFSALEKFHSTLGQQRNPVICCIRQGVFQTYFFRCSRIFLLLSYGAYAVCRNFFHIIF